MAKGRLWEKGEDLDKAVLAFTIGNDPDLDLRLVYWDAVASAAHASMLSEIGVLDEEERNDLLGALKGIAAAAREGTFEIPFELEDCHTAIETRLTELLGDTGARIHTGRSRNDQVLVAMRLYLRDSYLSVLENLCSFTHALLSRAEEFGHIIFPGHTHFRPAMPASLKMWLGAFAEDGLQLIRSGLRDFEEVNTNPLGAASGFGVPLPLNRSRTTQLLGFARTQRNPIHVQNSRGREELRFCTFACQIAQTLEKLAWDCILYSSEEFGFLSIPVRFTTGSSIMPQKRNPDVLELTRGRAGRIRGARAELDAVIGKLPSHYHRDFQYTKEPVFRAAENLLETLPTISKVLEGIAVHQERIEPHLTPELFATFDAYLLVEGGMPFRDAYRESARKLKEGNIEVSRLRKEFRRIAEGVDEDLVAARQELRELEAAVNELRASTRRHENAIF